MSYCVDAVIPKPCPCAHLPALSSCAHILCMPLFLPNENIVATIQDKFGHLYKQTLTTDSEGVVTINLSLFPKGLFNPHAGTFVLSFQKNSVPNENLGIETEFGIYLCFFLTFIDETTVV